MSDTTSNSPLFFSDTARDIYLWRRKKLSLLILSISTATWVLLDVYEFNFVTVASWAAIFIITSIFIYGNLVRLFRKEEPNMSGLEISEETAKKAARSVREIIGTGIRWMFHASSEREWFVFVRVVAVLWLLSYVGSFFDFLTLLYIGIVVGMSVPVLYVKNEDKVKRVEERTRMQGRRIYETLDDKIFKKVKNKVAKVEDRNLDKEKKAE